MAADFLRWSQTSIEPPQMPSSSNVTNNANIGLTPVDQIWRAVKPLSRAQLKTPQLVTLYMSGIDDASHAFGPDSEEVRDAVKRVDAYLSLLRNMLKQRDLYDDVNIFLVSDHGSASVSPEKIVYLDDINYTVESDHWDFDDRYELVWAGATAGVNVKAAQISGGALENNTMVGFVDAVEAHVQSVVGDPNLVICREKESMQRHFNFVPPSNTTGEVATGASTNWDQIVPPLLCTALPPWRISTRQFVEANPGFLEARGAHGYPNYVAEMGALFVARGPDIRSDLANTGLLEEYQRNADGSPASAKNVIKPFENVNLYELWCHLLGIDPSVNDGQQDLLLSLLSS